MLSKIRNKVFYAFSIIVICVYPVNYVVAEGAEQLKQIDYLISSHTFDKALEKLDEAIKFAPNNAELYRKKGYCLLISGAFKGAVENYDKAIALGDTSSGNLTNKAAALIKQGKPQEALEVTTIALSRTDGKIAENYHHLCGALTGLEKFKDAIVACDKAIYLEPGYAQIRGTRAVVLYSLKKYAEALIEISAAIELNSYLAELYYIKGIILNKLHREQEALKMFQKAASLKKYL